MPEASPSSTKVERLWIGPYGADGKPAEPFAGQVAVFAAGYENGRCDGLTVRVGLTAGTGAGKTGALDAAAWHSIRFNGTGSDRRTLLAAPTEADLFRNLLGPLLEHLPKHPKDKGANPVDRLKAATLSPAISSMSWGQRTFWLRPEYGGGAVTWETWGGASATSGIGDKGQGFSASALFVTEAQNLPAGAAEKFIARVRTPAPFMRILFEGLPITGTWFIDEWCEAPDVVWIKMDTRDNPFLSEDYAANITRNMSDKEAGFWLGGIPVPKTGRVISGYTPDYLDDKKTTPDPAGSLIDFEPVPGRACMLSWDFGYWHPHVILWQTIPDPRLYPKKKSNGAAKWRIKDDEQQEPPTDWMRETWVAVHEWAPRGVKTRPLAEEVWDDLVRFGLSESLQMVGCDPAGDRADSAADENDVAILRDVLGVPVKWPKPKHRGPGSVKRRCARLNTLFDVSGGRRRILVSLRLLERKHLAELKASSRHGLHQCLLNYGWRSRKVGGVTVRLDEPHKDDINDHGPDSAGYITMVVRPRDGQETTPRSKPDLNSGPSAPQRPHHIRPTTTGPSW